MLQYYYYINSDIDIHYRCYILLYYILYIYINCGIYKHITVYTPGVGRGFSPPIVEASEGEGDPVSE